MGYVKRHASTIAIAFVVASIAAATPVIAHGVRHALFAHEAGQANDAKRLGGTPARGFVKNKGEILVTMPYLEWEPVPATGVLRTSSGKSAATFRRSSTGEVDFVATPHVPTAMYGKRLRLKGVEMCIDATDRGVEYTEAEVVTYKNALGQFLAGPKAVGTEVDFNPPEDGKECHDYPFEPPVLLGPGQYDGLQLVMEVNWRTANTHVGLGRTTLVLQPTGKPVPPVLN